MQYEKVKTFFEDTKSNGYKFAIGEPEVKSGKGCKQAERYDSCLRHNTDHTLPR